MESATSLNLMQLFQILSIVLTGLLAGLFYGYECSVIDGLSKLSNDAYIQSFQSINKVIQNPYFFLSFIGSVFMLPIATWLSYNNQGNVSFYILLAATILYYINVFGITIFYNVPLNEQLANFSISSATAEEISEMRQVFESSWNYYHTIRTISAITAFVLTALSMFNKY